MAIVKEVARQGSSVNRVAEGLDAYLRAFRDGTMVEADWKQALVLEGRGFMVNVGAFSSGIVGGGDGTIIDQDQPELVVMVPKGTSIMPLRVEITTGFPHGAADDNEVDLVLAVDQDTMSVDGTATAEVIYNINTLHSRSSNCTANSLYTANMTAPVLDLELAHVAKAFEMHSSVDGQWTEFKVLYEPDTSPIINGPAMLIVYCGGTVAVEAFVSCQWLELPSDILTD